MKLRSFPTLPRSARYFATLAILYLLGACASPQFTGADAAPGAAGQMYLERAAAAYDRGDYQLALTFYADACYADASLCDIASFMVGDLGGPAMSAELLRSGCDRGRIEACEQAVGAFRELGDDAQAAWADQRFREMSSTGAEDVADYAPADTAAAAPEDTVAAAPSEPPPPPCPSGDACIEMAADYEAATGDLLGAVDLLDYGCTAYSSRFACEQAGLIVFSLGPSNEREQGIQRVERACALGSDSACRRAETMRRSAQTFGDNAPYWNLTASGLRFEAPRGWVFDVHAAHPIAPSAERVVVASSPGGLSAVFLIETTRSRLEPMDQAGEYITQWIESVSLSEPASAVAVPWTSDPAMRTRGTGQLDGEGARFELIAVPGPAPGSLVVALSMWTPRWTLPVEEAVLGDLLGALAPLRP
jgi:hypothetical protein